MLTLTGYANMKVELEVEEGLEDIEYESLFNLEVTRLWDRGEGDFDWSVEDNDE